MRDFCVIAHRGASARVPENTLAAIEAAVESGAQWVEIDVRACATGELVVIHDQWADRTTDGTGRIIDMPWSKVQQLRAGGEPVPRLEDVLNTYGSRVKLNIELVAPGLEEALLGCLRPFLEEGRWCYEDLMISSFWHATLPRLRQMDERLKTAALLGHLATDVERSVEHLGCEAVNIDTMLVDQAVVENLHHLGLKVLVYTVNQPENLMRLYRMGVDGVFTDDPKWLLTLLASQAIV